MKLYASIYVGTYETMLKVFQVTSDRNLKEIDCLRMPMELLNEINATGSISNETTNRLCNLLGDMLRTVQSYRISDYQVYATGLLYKAINAFFVLEQIKLRTGLNVLVRSNSEQRFLSYRAAASQKSFEDMISDSAAIIDVGGASIQITLFVNGKVRTTQHLGLGTVTIREKLRRFSHGSNRREHVQEIIYKELDVFTTMYLQDTKLKYLIILGDQMTSLSNIGTPVDRGVSLKADKCLDILRKLYDKPILELPVELPILKENQDLVEPYVLLHKAIAEKLPSKYVFFSGVSINEGMAYDFFAAKNALDVYHDFEQDIVSAAWAIARRYGSYQPHVKALDSISTQIYDVIKKFHGLGKRERLMMRVVAILHDCGKYISIAEASKCSYAIIMSSEILGLTHKERDMIATTVSMNRGSMLPYSEVADRFREEEYVTIIKFLAILRVANALDRSHKQKFKHIKMSLRGDKLNITMEAKDSIALEQGMFENMADFFERIFSIRPVLTELRIFE